MKRKTKDTTRVYLGEYILQRDMRVRMPKEIIKNLDVAQGASFFEIYLDSEHREIILSVKKDVKTDE